MKFVRNLKENKAHTNAPNQDQDQSQDTEAAPNKRQVNQKHADNSSIKQGNINTILSLQLKRLFNQLITINSTAFEDIDPETKELAFVGSKTETTLLQFAKDLVGGTGMNAHQLDCVMSGNPSARFYDS